MDDDPSNIVAFPGTEEPKQDVVRDFGDFAKAKLTDFEKKAGEAPAAMVLVLMDKTGNTTMDAYFIAGEEQGLARLYISHAASCLIQSATDSEK